MASKCFTSWSYSRLRDYKECPLKAKLKYLDKVPEPERPALARGNKVHELAESYIKGSIRCIPKELKAFEELFKELRKACTKELYPVYVEETISLTKDWELTIWNDWNNCTIRIKTDVMYIRPVLNSETGILGHHAFVIDWKTGKNDNRFKDVYEEQLELFALGTLIRFPNVLAVHPALYYLDDGSIYVPENNRYERKQLEKLQKKWFKESKAMLNDRKFSPKPNGNCKWCHYGKDRAGLCKF